MINTYSQYGEEIFLSNFFSNKIGFVCDIGAADGIRYSNSRKLIELGWSALLVEPNSTNFNKIQNLYENSDRVKTSKVCCYSHDCGLIDFYCDTYDGHGQISTMSTDFRDVCEKMYKPVYVLEKVNCRKTTNVFLENSVPSYIDFVSIDCEGVDYEVLCGIDFSLFDINLFCIENRDTRIHALLQENKYKQVFLTDGNVFYAK